MIDLLLAVLLYIPLITNHNYQVVFFVLTGVVSEGKSVDKGNGDEVNR